MEMIHPEKREGDIKKHADKLQRMWLEIVDSRLLEDVQEFQEALKYYVRRVTEYMELYSEKVDTVSSPTASDARKFTEKLKKTPVWQRVIIKLE